MSEESKWPHLEHLKEEFPYLEISIIKAIIELSRITHRKPKDLIIFLIKDALNDAYNKLTQEEYNPFIDLYCKDFGKEFQLAYEQINLKKEDDKI